MSALARLQSHFIDYLHDRPNDFLDTLADAGGLAKADRAHIYFNAYRVRLLDTLKDSFDKTWAWLGDERFESAALAWIADHPPSRFSLRPFGERYADGLGAMYPDDPEVSELARLDWAMRQAFDGADAEPVTGATLAGFDDGDWAQVVFRLHPTAQWLRVTRNTLDLWHAMDRSDAPPQVEVLDRPGSLLVWRKGFQPHFRSIGDDEAAMLQAMASGTPFAAACESVLAEDARTLIGGWLARWLDDELLVIRPNMP
ncbi:MAG: putative DNA-binding domain-containing protein [Methyloversatilis sp.]|uniref:HvfC/BufC N-terminal domain-containing protein n=1 Tax=Methyloversatilis sp. TaxID=2569862 RepID=UPI001A55B5E6|nr:DNA-binding domain-containing protein [Methyloversatilis sp.]MBL8476964.1 putative DNA-binding domain-containing protein [Methyloversatilis sp.]